MSGLLKQRWFCLLIALLLTGGNACSAFAAPADWFGIEVVDEQTGRGIPLVELETVHHVRYVTDSAGWVALNEPELMNRACYFTVRSHGYEVAADGFGFRGQQLKPIAGQRAQIKIRRQNIAERLYRITGAGIYRDSVLLGIKTPLAEPLLNANVTGQDTVMAAIYRNQIRWFWGDTNRIGYPLGMFRTSGAVSELPSRGGLDPALGVNLKYFVDPSGFSRAMCEHRARDGVIWIGGLCVVRDKSGAERLLAHYSRRKDLTTELEHGIMHYDDAHDRFDVLRSAVSHETWQRPDGQTLTWRDGDQDYLAFAAPMPNVRVPPQLEAVADPVRYEGFGLWEPDVSVANGAPAELPRDAQGHLQWRWGRNVIPLGPQDERKLIADQKMSPNEARFLPRDADGKAVLIHAASVHWNEYLKRWVMIGEQHGGTSLLGEIWYSTAVAPTGPWRKAVKIVSHDKYTFYNPAHHPFFDQAGGRVIYFEATYTNSFSGNPDMTPRYDYNQVMYRLDLSDERLKGVIATPE